MVNAVMGMVVVVLFVVVFVGMVMVVLCVLDFVAPVAVIRVLCAVVTYVSVTYVLLPSVSGIGMPHSPKSTIVDFSSGVAQARPKKKLAIAAFEGGLPGGYPSNTGAPGAVALPLPGFKPFLSTDGEVVDVTCRGCWRGCQPRQQPRQAPSTSPGCSSCCATGAVAEKKRCICVCVRSCGICGCVVVMRVVFVVVLWSGVGVV